MRLQRQQNAYIWRKCINFYYISHSQLTHEEVWNATRIFFFFGYIERAKRKIPRGMAFIEKTFFGWFTIEKKQLSYCLFFSSFLSSLAHACIHTLSHKRVEKKYIVKETAREELKKYVDCTAAKKKWLVNCTFKWRNFFFFFIS